MATTELEKTMKKLETQLASEFAATKSILHEGDRIILPVQMSNRAAVEAIMRFDKEMEEETRDEWYFDCHPSDGLVAINTAISEQFGALMGQPSFNPFMGWQPAKSKSVDIGYEETVSVPVGEAAVPGLPVTFKIMPDYDEEDEDGGSLTVLVTYKRLYEPLVKRIEIAARNQLRYHSIFKGKAINSKWEFINAAAFDTERVVYSKNERTQIEANILAPIRYTREWVHNGSSLKRGILLIGPYGTGKTLTAMVAAKTAVDNGWTFVLVTPGGSIVQAIKFAKRYEPAVVFFEDIDSETSGERDGDLNAILNTVDGLLSKDSKVMVVLTTNHQERISRAMLRPGRLDAVIRVGELDAQGIADLVRVVAQGRDHTEILSGELEPLALYDAATTVDDDGVEHVMVPAFIVESVTKAKAYAMLRNEGNGKLRITNDDIVNALIELRPQWEMMQSDQVRRPDTMATATQDVVLKAVKPMQEQIERMYKRIV